ncbi:MULTISPECIES: hypothetical protein [Catenuloplanes]|uniref:Uncharacterized protein n=1 Tax=Catenuloplanes niger TaxID=587534 RepID=A0AAE3ZNB3_9ACTN|nr:hypothetical protein [Catenuloplanes niger]MDR7321770.1 hypothetical protein [Catenuloplanes niger]
MPHELVTHARHEAAYLGGQVRELLAWWMGISFGGLSATLGLVVALWPATVDLWGGVFVGMWLLGVAFCRVSDLLTDPRAATRARRLPARVATAVALVGALVVLRGLIGVGAPLAITVTVVLSLIAAADVSTATRRGLRSRVGARAAVYLPAALAAGAGAISGQLPAATVAVAALAVGIVEAATAATTGMKSLRWHAAARDAGLLTGEIRPFRESPAEVRPEFEDVETAAGPGAPDELPVPAALVADEPTEPAAAEPAEPAAAEPAEPAADEPAVPAADEPVEPEPTADGSDTRGPATAVTGGTPLGRRPAGTAPRSAGRPAGRATVNRPAVGRARVTSQD